MAFFVPVLRTAVFKVPEQRNNIFCEASAEEHFNGRFRHQGCNRISLRALLSMWHVLVRVYVPFLDCLRSPSENLQALHLHIGSVGVASMAL